MVAMRRVSADWQHNEELAMRTHRKMTARRLLSKHARKVRWAEKQWFSKGYAASERALRVLGVRFAVIKLAEGRHIRMSGEML